MSVTAAQGFRAAGVRAGLKASGKPDLALVVNDGPLDTAAGVFTSSGHGGSWPVRKVPGRATPAPSSSTPAVPTPAPARRA